MKKLGVLIVALVFATVTTFAQERGGGQRPSRTEQGRPGGQGRPQMNPEEMVKRQTARLVEELKLNQDQEANVLAINRKYMEKNPVDWSKMREASDEERAEMREKRMKVQNEKNKEIKSVLTPEQVKLFDENLKKREEMRRNNQDRPGPGGPQ